MRLVQNSTLVFDHIERVGIIPAIRTADCQAAVRTAAAIFEGGIPVVEVSLALPGGLKTLQSVVRELGADMLVGAGTVLNGSMTRQAQEAGSRFIVTNGFDASAIEAAGECNIPIFPGGITPTEVQCGMAAGCKVIKLYPCYAMKGPDYVRMLHGQYPGVDFVASGGVSLENCSQYICAGACAVGVGAAIADSDSISLGEFRIFRERAKRFRKAIAEAQARWRSGTLAEA